VENGNRCVPSGLATIGMTVMREVRGLITLDGSARPRDEPQLIFLKADPRASQLGRSRPLFTQSSKMPAS